MTAPPPPGPILAGIDGTPSGLDALELGRALAGLTGAPLVLVAVHGYETLASLFGGPGWPTRADAWEWLRRASLTIDRSDPVRLAVIEADSVAHGLAALARREAASLVVLGTSARSAAGRLRAGSGTRRVLHDARCPVAVAPVGWRAWSHAARPVFGAAETSGARGLAAPIAAAAGAALELLPGDPEECLAAARDLDLLVVGSHRHGPWRTGACAVLAGRTACPLLIVPDAQRGPTGADVPRTRPRASSAATAT
jgi:nucleotide-binding universal stress UspA family protein